MADGEAPPHPDLLPEEAVDKFKKAVTPAKAGVPNLLKPLDSRFHENDEKGRQHSFIDTLQGEKESKLDVGGLSEASSPNKL